jgi:hypothetical protein
MRSRTAVFSTNPTPTLAPTPAVTPEPLTCPNVSSLVRSRVHRRPTRIVVTFRGAVDPVQAQNPGNYALVGPGRDGVFGTADDEHIGIVSAVIDPSAESVTLAPSRRLNLRDHVLFSIKAGVFGCPNGYDFVTLLGGGQDLGGFPEEVPRHVFTVQHGHGVGMSNA